MPETLERNYHSISDMEQEVATGLGRKFFVIVAGTTNEAHLEFVEKLRRVHHIEVFSPEKCDYILLFCPVTSRVGTDIGEALEISPGGKPTILVVMHHTFNPELIVADSRRQVEDLNVRLTVDCLFHENKLLLCNRNDIAWSEIQRTLGVQTQEIFTRNTFRAFAHRKSHWSVRTGCEVIVQVLQLIHRVTQILKFRGLGRKFFVIVAGTTNEAHLEFVEKLRRVRHIEVFSPEECDYILLFCPVTSRVGTDIGEALGRSPGGKPTILVVMHHTFNPELTVADSRRQVEDLNVRLTVDCLFRENKLLSCNRNDIAWSEIQETLGLLPQEITTWNTISNWFWNNRTVVVAASCFLVGVAVISRTII